MPLPTPNLDDRHFQDIVDEAKRLIPRYCPEWTDHNVSDPGVALIELFAWMTDMVLYRVNQVPDKMYVKFLELIGVKLAPPRSAQAPITFYLSAPQPTEVTVPRDTEVATVRTETSPSIIFTTEADLAIRPPAILGAFTLNRSRNDASAWTTHDLRQLELRDQSKIAMFPKAPTPGDAFYIAFEGDHSRHVLALVVECEEAGGRGIDPRNPPLEWQVRRGGVGGWATCEVEFDGTGGFNRSGEIILHLPDMTKGTIQSLPQSPRAFWLRCQLTDAQAGDEAYETSPSLKSLQAEARGGTVGARHAVAVTNETLGYSDGTPGQQFKLLNGNLLARDPQRDYLFVEPPGVPPEQWAEVADFAASGADDRHFTVDSHDGTITLGPALLQPDGSVYRFGAVPTQSSLLRFSRYQYGGGIAGNVPRHAINVLKSSIPYIARITNRQAAVGGRDAQSLDDAKLRAPQVLRTRTRAMTADDYEYLAREVPGVARACCLAPGAQPGGESDPQPGYVAVLVLPQTEQVEARIAPEALNLSAELILAVRAYLDERRPLGIALDIRQPQYVSTAVQATLRVSRRSDPATQVEVQQLAEAALYRYINPYIGGPDRQGWPFGRDLHTSELYGLLQRIPGVEFVEQIQIGVVDAASGASIQSVQHRLELPRSALACSARHQVIVKLEGAA